MYSNIKCTPKCLTVRNIVCKYKLVIVYSLLVYNSRSIDYVIIIYYNVSEIFYRCVNISESIPLLQMRLEYFHIQTYKHRMHQTTDLH